MPAKCSHKPHYNSRTNYRTKEAAIENKGACLTLFVFIKPFVLSHCECRINRCFAQAKHQTDNCKGILTACHSSQGSKYRPPAAGNRTGKAMAEFFSQHTSRNLHQSITGEKEGLNKAHINFSKAKFLHDYRCCNRKVNAVHVGYKTDSKDQPRYLPSKVCHFHSFLSLHKKQILFFYIYSAEQLTIMILFLLKTVNVFRSFDLCEYSSTV